MARILEGFENSYKGVNVSKINLMENMDYAKKYGVRVVPTLVFLDPQGELLYRHEGIMSSKELRSKWEELGYSVEKQE
ncbi:MAG: thioredoxin [Synergistales bacterium]|nr:thioredoxin family protein [Dethiosulfovibrio sp.]NCC96538.1 thioredoxin [Synergistales bacterium]